MTNPKRAAEFYKDVFGWKFEKWDGPQEYWLISTGDKDKPGIDGGLSRRSSDFDFAPVTNVIDVPSVMDFSEKISSSGGSVVVPRTAIPGIGWIAYCKDPEGTIFGIYRTDMEAK